MVDTRPEKARVFSESIFPTHKVHEETHIDIGKLESQRGSAV